MQQISYRVEKINQLILREISLILRNNIKDPRLTNIQITEVITSKDLSTSKIFFHCDKDNLTDIKKSLIKAKNFIRSSIAKNLKLRHTPELNFKYDDSAEKFSTIENILKNIKD